MCKKRSLSDCGGCVRFFLARQGAIDLAVPSRSNPTFCLKDFCFCRYFQFLCEKYSFSVLGKITAPRLYFRCVRGFVEKFRPLTRGACFFFPFPTPRKAGTCPRCVWDRGYRAQREISLENSKKIAFTRRFDSLYRTLFCFEVEIIRPHRVLCSPEVPGELLEA